MESVFYYSKHKALWQYMAKKETIMKIANTVKNKCYHDIKDAVDNVVGATKRKYINDTYNEEVICSCYACKACEHKCYECPILIGRCYEEDSCFNNYIKAIAFYVVTGDNKYIEEAHEYAIIIAMAGLKGDILIDYNLEVK